MGAGVNVGAEGQHANGQAGISGPLPAELVLGAAPVFKEPRLQGGHLFWLEQLPAQQGRTTLRMRHRCGSELELTPGLDLRSRIHGYGGGVYCVAGGSWADDTTASGRIEDGAAPGASEVNRLPVDACRVGCSPPDREQERAQPMGSRPSDLTVVVVAEAGRSLWRLDLPAESGAETSDAAEADTGASSPASATAPPAVSLAAPLPAPVRLTPEIPAGRDASRGEPSLFGDGLIDLARRRWIGVCEQDGRDRLVAVPLSGGAPQLLWQSPDFCGYAALSPSGSHLAWVSWRQPCMPWDRSQLWLGRFDTGGALVDARPVAGSAPGDAEAISVFQPLWAGQDLVVAGDRSGWWNLELLENAASLSAEAAPAWQPLLPMQAEFAMPQWVYGMRTTAWDGQRLVAACCRDGRWELGALVPESPSTATQATADGPTRDRGMLAGAPLQPAPRPAAGDVSATEPDAGLDKDARAGGTDQAAMPPDKSLGTERAAAEPGATAAACVAPTNPVDRGGASRHGHPIGAAGPGEGLRGPLHWQPIPLPFDDLACLDAEAGRLVAIASGPVDGPGLLELSLLDLASAEPRGERAAESAADAMGQPVGVRLEPGTAAPEESPPEGGHGGWTHRLAAPALLAPQQVSRPESLWFSGHGGRPTHAWYYPPRGGASPASPLLLRGHSGPTGMARTGLSLAIQFWTSRGWGVVDVNYGGSTGFGRAYRERLDGLWGVVDVDDCLAAARAVVEAGHADPDRIAMEGSSASGFTVLAAMARGDTLRAGAIRYPVTDLTALAECDHRFEARYFDALVGPWPSARAIYEQRSPLQQADRIHAPLLVFHGLDDTVVPAQQSIAMVERLKARGVPVELQVFEGEGHGFRDGAVQRQVLERSEAFFRERFGFGAGG